ncbi:MAG: extracellular solute-binding protein [Candidatus Gastranaerophilales bacterium]|nr:extracellular solute-binding protein [Candidatus Gastranaerophilales bacterium]
MKKFAAIIVIIIITLSVFFAFWAKRGVKQSENELVFWTLQLGTFDKYITKIISDFESENPEIKIKWVDVPYSEGEKRTLAALLSDNPPDLINLTPDFSAMAAQKNALYEIPQDAMEQFPNGLLPLLSYKGKVFAIPFYLTSAVTYANKSILSKAKITSFPKTFEDMYALSETIKTQTGCYVEMPALSENDTFWKVLNKYGVNVFTNIDGDVSRDIFKMYESAYKNNLIPRESITQGHREALEKYMAGQVAFLQAGANFLNIIKENAPTVYEETEIIPQLTGKNAKYDLSLMNLIIPRKAKNKEYALKFALFLTNEQNQLELAKLTSVLPANKNALNNEYFKKNSSKEEIARNISAKQIMNIAPNIENTRHKKNVILLLNSTLAKILTGKKDLSQGLVDLKEKIKDYEE